jgi:hypothetical protein
MVSRRRLLGVMGGAGAFGVLGGGCAAAPPARPRTVEAVIAPRRTRVGEVFQVQRTLPGAGRDQVDPFLMLDHFDFTLRPGQRGGLAPHPHRGQETVTVLLDGAIEHGDSLGNRAVLLGGDVQWMTAASGIVHEENPADAVRASGGRIHGVQLWVNLPRAAKGLPPGYQDRAAAEIPTAAESGVTLRVLAGAFDGLMSPLVTQSPLALYDATLAPGARLELRQPVGWTAFVHLVSGSASIGETVLGPAHLADLDRMGDAVVLTAGSGGARALIGGGAPIGEPLARGGPFVLNTEAELAKAYADYRAGRMGHVADPTYDRIRLPG